VPNSRQRATFGPIQLVEGSWDLLRVFRYSLKRQGAHMISPVDVVYAYRLLLGRDPENEATIVNWASSVASLEQLREIFISSEEFKAQHAASQLAQQLDPLTCPRMQVDVWIPDSEVDEMTRRVELCWQTLGRVEPHWSVLTDETFRASRIEQSVDSFFQSGKHPVELLKAATERQGIRLREYRDCFELGCGVGRVSIWLSRQFDRVIAADISPTHLKLAREAIDKHRCSNGEFLKLDTIADLRRLPQFDVFFSVIVLQHNPPPVMARMLRVILRRLRSPGIAYFQIPTYQRGYNFSAAAYLETANNRGEMEMHAMPQDALFKLFTDCGCQLLEIREDNWTRIPSVISNSILLRKDRDQPAT
jgi:SAM-dependent methyltransferase